MKLTKEEFETLKMALYSVGDDVFATPSEKDAVKSLIEDLDG